MLPRRLPTLCVVARAVSLGHTPCVSTRTCGAACAVSLRTPCGDAGPAPRAAVFAICSTGKSRTCAACECE